MNYNKFPLDIFKDKVCSRYLQSVRLQCKRETLSIDTGIEQLLSSVFSNGLFEGASGINSILNQVSNRLIQKELDSFTPQLLNSIAQNHDIKSTSLLYLVLIDSCAKKMEESEIISLGTLSKGLAKGVWGTIKHLNFKEGLKSAIEVLDQISNKFIDYRIIYYLAFLLNVYKVIGEEYESTVTALIKEILLYDSTSDFSLSTFSKLLACTSSNSIIDLYKNQSDKLRMLMTQYKVSESLQSFVEKYGIKEVQDS